MSLTATPDRFDVAKGDVIDWTILLENDGDGTAYGAAFNATLDRPATDKHGFDSALNRPELHDTSVGCKGADQIEGQGRVICGRLHCRLQCQLGPRPLSGGENGLLARSKDRYRKQPDNLRSFAIGEVVSYEVEADLPKGAHKFWINDTIPRGLIYNQSSPSLHGSAPLQEVHDPNSDGSLEICRLFGDAGTAQTITITYNAGWKRHPSARMVSCSLEQRHPRAGRMDRAARTIVTKPVR